MNGAAGCMFCCRSIHCDYAVRMNEGLETPVIVITGVNSSWAPNDQTLIL